MTFPFNWQCNHATNSLYKPIACSKLHPLNNPPGVAMGATPNTAQGRLLELILERQLGNPDFPPRGGYWN